MQTGDAELEMRGRCSAGQKVIHVHSYSLAFVAYISLVGSIFLLQLSSTCSIIMICCLYSGPCVTYNTIGISWNFLLKLWDTGTRWTNNKPRLPKLWKSCCSTAKANTIIIYIDIWGIYVQNLTVVFPISTGSWRTERDKRTFNWL